MLALESRMEEVWVRLPIRKHREIGSIKDPSAINVFIGKNLQFLRGLSTRSSPNRSQGTRETKNWSELGRDEKSFIIHERVEPISPTCLSATMQSEMHDHRDHLINAVI